MAPLPYFRLVQRIASSSMLSCIDSEVLCHPVRSVEEVFLLRGDGHPARILDVTPAAMSGGGEGFEEQAWRSFLPSLKPIGLASLLHARALDNPIQPSEACTPRGGQLESLAHGEFARRERPRPHVLTIRRIGSRVK